VTRAGSCAHEGGKQQFFLFLHRGTTDPNAGDKKKEATVPPPPGLQTLCVEAAMEALLGVGRFCTRFCCARENDDDMPLLQEPKVFREDSAVTAEKEDDGTEPDAHRLSKAMGLSPAVMHEALPGLNRCVARRLPGRRVYKPLDLSVLTTFVKSQDGETLLKHGAAANEWPADVEEELSALTPASRGEVEGLLRRAHLCGGYFPKIGQGCAGLHKALPSAEHTPTAHAYEHGCRLFPSTDPFVGTPLEHVHDYEAFARELKSKDFSSALYMGMVNPNGRSWQRRSRESRHLRRPSSIASGLHRLHIEWRAHRQAGE
jgi:hypothetical protein